MQTTQNPKQPDDPHDVLVVAPDVVLMAPTDEELSRLARTLRGASNPLARNEPDFAAGPAVPPVDTTFRPATVGDLGRRSIGQRAARGFGVALLLALCAGIANIAWQSWGDAAEQMIAQWVPPHILATVLPQEGPAPSAQPAPPAADATVNAAAPQPIPVAQTAPEGAAATAAAPSAEPAPPPASVPNDVASLRQEIEQLKASVEQLKAGQQQISRDIAKASEIKASEIKASEPRASEPNPRPRISALPPRPSAPRARRPMPPQAAMVPTMPQAPAPYAAPYVPRQVEPPPPAADQPLADPELASVPRPPMPVR
jgi:hypothetical protein